MMVESEMLVTSGTGPALEFAVHHADSAMIGVVHYNNALGARAHPSPQDRQHTLLDPHSPSFV